MAVLRELIARYDAEFDSKSFDKANKSIDGTSAALKKLGSVLTGVAVAFGLKTVIGLASDANETLNILGEVFGDNADSVKEWADVVAKESGRSRFKLLELAGELGAVINPLLEGNAEAAAEMSTSLTQLSVDLGSFFNITEDDALTKLRSGLVGEVEPLRRLGVDLTEAALAQFALDEGITKTVKSMTIAEKTQLRYDLIMIRTVNSQGDAIRTAEGFANASKALGGALRDLGTTIGLVILPVVERMLNGALLPMVRSFEQVTQRSRIVEAAFVALSAVAAVLAARWIAANAAMLLSFLRLAFVAGIVVLVIDDFLTLLAGGDSLIGRFIDSIFGPGSAANAVQLWSETWTEFVANFKAGLLIIDEGLVTLGGLIDEASEGFSRFGSDIAEIATFIADAFTGAWETVTSGFDDMLANIGAGFQILSGGFEEIARFLGVELPKFSGELDKERDRQNRNRRANRGGARTDRQTVGRGVGSSTIQRDALATTPFSGTGRRGVAQRRTGRVLPQRGGGSSVTQNVGGIGVTINAETNASPEAIGEATQKAIRTALDQQNRNALDAVKQGGR